MKKMLFSAGFLLSSLLINAQKQKTTFKIRRFDVLEQKQTKGPSTKQVAGSLTCNTQYVAGTIMDLSFTLTLTNTDGEYCDLFSLTFPTGITPVSSPTNPFSAATEGQDSEALNGVSGQTISWGDNDNSYGGIQPGTAHNFTVKVNVASGTTGNMNVTFNASGDGFGPSPGDILNGTSIIYPAGSPMPDLKSFYVGTFHNGYLERTCSFGQDTVLVAITNIGNTTESNILVNYSVNGTTVGQSAAFHPSTGSPDIAPGDTAIAYFVPAFDFSAAGIYTINAWVCSIRRCRP
jgi:hypothetical protein